VTLNEAQREAIDRMFGPHMVVYWKPNPRHRHLPPTNIGPYVELQVAMQAEKPMMLMPWMGAPHSRVDAVEVGGRRVEVMERGRHARAVILMDGRGLTRGAFIVDESWPDGAERYTVKKRV
jgi:hypothetical protein